MMLSSAGMGGIIRNAGFAAGFILSGAAVVTVLCLFLRTYPSQQAAADGV